MAKILNAIYSCDTEGRVTLVSADPVRPLAPYRVNVRAPFDPNSTTIKWFLNLPVGATDQQAGFLDVDYTFDGEFYQWSFVIEEARTDGLNTGPGVSTDNELIISFNQDKTLPTYDPETGAPEGTVEVEIPLQLEVIKLTVEGFQAVPLTTEPIDNDVEAGFNSRIASLEADQLDYNNKIKKTTFKNDRVKGSLDSLPFGDDNALASEGRVRDYISRAIQQSGATEDIEQYSTKAALDTNTDFVNGLLTSEDTLRTYTLAGGERVTAINDETFGGTSARYQWNAVVKDWINIFNTSLIPSATATNDGLQTSQNFNETQDSKAFTDAAWNPVTGKINNNVLSVGTRIFKGKIENDGDLPTDLTVDDTGFEYISNGEFTDTNFNLDFQRGDIALWVETEFIKLDNKDDVLSVQGKKGDVTLNAKEILLEDDSATIEDELVRIDGRVTQNVVTKLDKTSVVKESDGLDTVTDSQVLSAAFVKELLNSKTSKLNNNSFNCVISGFTNDDISIIDLDTWGSNSTGVVKFVLPPQAGVNEGLPSSIGYAIKPFQSTNPFVGVQGSFASAAQLKPNFNQLITAQDISDNGANLLIDIDETVRLLKIAGTIDDENDLIGLPTVELIYLDKMDDFDDAWRTGAFVTAFSHINNSISTLRSFGYTATQGVLSAQYIDKGLPVYQKSGGNIIGSSNSDYGINRLPGKVFFLGADRGNFENNPDIIEQPTILEDIRIVKAYPDGAGGTIYDDNNGNYYTEINHEEYYDTEQNELSTTGIGGSDTLVSLLGVLLTEPNTLVQVLPQVVDGTDNDVVNDSLFDNKEDAIIQLSGQGVNYSDIGILSSAIFLPIANLVVESSASNLTSDTEDFAFVPVNSLGGSSTFDNNGSEVPAINVKNTGVVGFDNQELLNISVDSTLSFRASEDIRIENKVDAAQADANTIIGRINTQREFTYNQIGDGSTTDFDFNIGYITSDVIDIYVGGLKFNENNSYELEDLTGGSLRVKFSANEIPRNGYTIELRQVKAI